MNLMKEMATFTRKIQKIKTWTPLKAELFWICLNFNLEKDSKYTHKKSKHEKPNCYSRSTIIKEKQLNSWKPKNLFWIFRLKTLKTVKKAKMLKMQLTLHKTECMKREVNSKSLVVVMKIGKIGKNADLMSTILTKSVLLE